MAHAAASVAPAAAKDGIVNPRGLLESVLDPPPAHAHTGNDDLVLDSHADQLPEIVIVIPTHVPLFILPEKPEHATPPEVSGIVRAVVERLARLRG